MTETHELLKHADALRNLVPHATEVNGTKYVLLSVEFVETLADELTSLAGGYENVVSFPSKKSA
jgi:hypothetical protein|tara:strand:+ start:12252 stop:12443 length:192 start_codon:yes stop_codon:yes gene_type:complete